MELAQYLAPLRKWWWLLLVSAALAAVSGYLVVGQQPPIYQATATLLIGRTIEEPNPTGGDLYLAGQLAETYANIASRQPVRELTKAALGLDWLPDYFAKQIPNSQLLEITVTDTDPTLAQMVANELANQLILQSPSAPKPEDQEREVFIQDQLNSLQVKIGETEAEIVEREDELNNAFSAREIADLEIEIAGLQNKLSTLQSNYSSLLANTQGGAVNTLTLIEPAALPTEPVGPDLAIIILAAATAALGLAAGTAYLLEYLDDTLRGSKDIERISNMLSLPSIPKIDGGNNPGLVISLEQPREPATDAFRALRETIQHRLKDKSNGLLLVTSTKPKEGKSLVTANLAVVLAQAGYNTLLVDADLHRPSQGELFKLSNHIGLSDLLINYTRNGKDSELWTLLEDVVQPSDQDHLSVLLSGSKNSHLPHIASPESIRNILSKAAEHYDYIIVDSPPLLATSDAQTLSTAVDGVILVTYVGKTRRRELRHAIKQLQDVEANLVGVVPNGLKLSSENYYYRYYHYYAESDTKRNKKEQTPASQNGTNQKKKHSTQYY